MFDGELDKISAEKHIQGFEHFLDLFEVEQDDECMRDFSQSLQGEAKRWFGSILVGSIANFQHFEHTLLDRWEVNKTPF